MTVTLRLRLLPYITLRHTLARLWAHEVPPIDVGRVELDSTMRKSVRSYQQFTQQHHDRGLSQGPRRREEVAAVGDE